MICKRTKCHIIKTVRQKALSGFTKSTVLRPKEHHIRCSNAGYHHLRKCLRECNTVLMTVRPRANYDAVYRRRYFRKQNKPFRRHGVPDAEQP